MQTAATAAARHCDLSVAVGTSAVVQSAAGLADLARRHGTRTAEINPAETALSAHIDLRIQARAADALPELMEALGHAASD